MKKNVEVINAQASLLAWAEETLEKAPSKPSGAEELLHAITGLLKGSCSALFIETDSSIQNTPNTRKISCGSLSIYPSLHKVIRDGKEIALTPKEFDILYFLAENRGEVFTKEQIYRAVWEERYLLDDSNIMAFIRKIRKKIEPNPDEPQFILTVWGIGYKFSESV